MHQAAAQDQAIPAGCRIIKAEFAAGSWIVRQIPAVVSREGRISTFGGYGRRSFSELHGERQPAKRLPVKGGYATLL